MPGSVQAPFKINNLNDDITTHVEHSRKLDFESGMLQIGMGWFPEQAGGLNRYFYGLVNSIRNEDINIHAMVAGQKKAAGLGVENFADSKASISRRLLSARCCVRKQLNSHPDLVASHFALYAFPAIDLIKRFPFVAHFHGPWADEKRREGDSGYSNKIKKYVERTVYRKADRIITLSKNFADVVSERYGIDRERIVVVPGGVDTKAYDCQFTRARARSELNWPQDRPIVLCVRRLVARMGFESLIEATKVAAAKIPEILVMIGGRGPMQNRLQELIRNAGLTNQIRLLGFVPDEILPTAYRAADVSIVPSETLEGFGLTAVESLASGTPALVTPIGGLPEVVGDLSPNLILPNTDVPSIAEGMVLALRGNLRLPSSEECSAYASKNFDWQCVLPKILTVYRQSILQHATK